MGVKIFIWICDNCGFWIGLYLFLVQQIHTLFFIASNCVHQYSKNAATLGRQAKHSEKTLRKEWHIWNSKEQVI